MIANVLKYIDVAFFVVVAQHEFGLEGELVTFWSSQVKVKLNIVRMQYGGISGWCERGI